jgi:uncharacterized protein YecT (DUF1311 family)
MRPLKQVARFALLVLALCVAGIGYAGEPLDSIDSQLDQCLSVPDNASTGGQTDCIGKAQKDWDKRMNHACAQLMRELPSAPASSLRVAQRTWLTFRDAESKAQLDFYTTRHGTMYVPMEANAVMTLTRDRARQLEAYVSTLNIEGP